MLVLFHLAQTPAPVYNIKVKPSKTSAIVTWDIVTEPEGSSYITHYQVYIDQKFLEKMDRKNQGMQYNITGLIPYTFYGVGIEAVDGSSQTSKREYKNFMTNEAGSFLILIGGQYINNQSTLI